MLGIYLALLYIHYYIWHYEHYIHYSTWQYKPASQSSIVYANSTCGLKWNLSFSEGSTFAVHWESADDPCPCRELHCQMAAVHVVHLVCGSILFVLLLVYQKSGVITDKELKWNKG